MPMVLRVDLSAFQYHHCLTTDLPVVMKIHEFSKYSSQCCDKTCEELQIFAHSLFVIGNCLHIKEGQLPTI